jgi:hypothetical protein
LNPANPDSDKKELKDEQDKYKQSISLNPVNPVNPDSDKLHRT